ncbi:FAD-binding oxidoreductase [Sessilibacter sp. MAH4]
MQDNTTTKITYLDKTVVRKAQNSVLETLLSEGIIIPNSCRAGVCQSCLMKASDATKEYLPKESQKGLNQAEIKLGYFLACSCYPEHDLSVGLPVQNLEANHHVKIQSIQNLSASVYQLCLPEVIKYSPGQFINLSFNTNQTTYTRSYSIASVPNLDSNIILHVKKHDHGVFGQWLESNQDLSKNIEVSGPFGQCFYTSDLEELTTGLLLVGISTGLAPLYGILRDALQQGYDKPIHLVFGAKTDDGLYLLEQLKELPDANKNVQLHFVTQKSFTQQSSSNTPVIDVLGNVDIYDYCANLPLDYSTQAAFICGAQTFVNKLKKSLFLKGIALRNIKSDAFVAATQIKQ